MINLYTADYCPYCHKVMEFLEANNISYENKDIKEASNRQVVIAAGKMQIPYMLDTDTGNGIYESEEIINYINKFL